MPNFNLLLAAPSVISFSCWVIAWKSSIYVCRTLKCELFKRVSKRMLQNILWFLNTFLRTPFHRLKESWFSFGTYNFIHPTIYLSQHKCQTAQSWTFLSIVLDVTSSLKANEFTSKRANLAQSYISLVLLCSRESRGVSFLDSRVII